MRIRTYSQYTQLNCNKDFLQSHNYKQVKQWDKHIQQKYVDIGFAFLV